MSFSSSISHQKKSKARRSHASRTCLLCRERKTRCELPDPDISVANEEALPEGKKCHRCRKLGVDCIVSPSPKRSRPSSNKSMVSGPSIERIEEGSIEEEQIADTFQQANLPPQMIHTFGADDSLHENSSQIVRSNALITSANQSLDLMGKGYATLAWFVRARTLRSKCKLPSHFTEDVLQLIDAAKHRRLSNGFDAILYVVPGLPRPDAIRKQVEENPTASRQFLLATLYFCLHLLLRSAPNSTPEGSLDDIEALSVILMTSSDEVVRESWQLPVLQALLLLSVFDPLGIVLSHSSRASAFLAAPDSRGILLVDTFFKTTATLNDKKQWTKDLQECITLNRLWLTIDMELVSDPPPPSGYNTFDYRMSMAPSSDARKVSAIFRHYRLAMVRTYIEAAQRYGTHVKEAQNLMALHCSLEHSWSQRMWYEWDIAQEQLNRLEQECFLSLHDERLGNMRVAEEMRKICSMECSNMKGSLVIFLLRGMLWPYIDSQGFNPFASCEMMRDKSGGLNGENFLQDDGIAGTYGKCHQLNVKIMMSIAKNEIPTEIPPGYIPIYKQALEDIGPIRLTAAQNTLAIFVEYMSSFPPSSPVTTRDVEPFAWTPSAMICGPVIEAAKTIMEAQMAFCVQIGREAEQALTWSILIRQASIGLQRLNCHDGNLSSSKIQPLVSLYTICSEIIRDMDAISMRARHALREKQARDGVTIATTSLSDAGTNLRATSSSLDTTAYSSGLASSSPHPRLLNPDGTYQSLDAFWQQDPLEQLFVAWNQTPSSG